MLKNLPKELKYVLYPFGYGFIGAKTFDESSRIFDSDSTYLTMLAFFEDLKGLA